MHKLSTQEYASVVTGLRAQLDPSARDLRSASRLQVEGKSTVWWMDAQGQPQPGVTVFVQDLSLTGVGFLCSRAASMGEAFVLGLSREQGGPLLVGCEVCRASEVADGIYRVGGRFVQAMNGTRAERAKAVQGV